MKRIIYICMIYLIAVQSSLAAGYMEYHELCGKGGRTSGVTEVLSVDEFITNKLKIFYKNANICNEIGVTNHDITSNLKDFIISLKIGDTIFLMKNSEIIYEIDDSKYQSLIIGVDLSNNGKDYAYIFRMGEQRVFLENIGYKHLLGFYLNGVRIQDFDYKRGINHFYKKHNLQYYFGTESINGDFDYEIQEELNDMIDQKISYFNKEQKIIVMKYMLKNRILYESKSQDKISLIEYKRQVMLDVIYSKLKIEELILKND